MSSHRLCRSLKIVIILLLLWCSIRKQFSSWNFLSFPKYLVNLCLCLQSSNLWSLLKWFYESFSKTMASTIFYISYHWKEKSHQPFAISLVCFLAFFLFCLVKFLLLLFILCFCCCFVLLCFDLFFVFVLTLLECWYFWSSLIFFLIIVIEYFGFVSSRFFEFIYFYIYLLTYFGFFEWRYLFRALTILELTL